MFSFRVNKDMQIVGGPFSVSAISFSLIRCWIKDKPNKKQGGGHNQRRPTTEAAVTVIHGDSHDGDDLSFDFLDFSILKLKKTKNGHIQ